MSLPLFGDKEYRPYRPLLPTPEEIPLETACWSISLPNNPAWWALLQGALLPLADPDNFQVFDGGLTREVTADIFDNALLDAFTDPSLCRTVPTPYWDESTDVDDEAPADAQTWYGEVEDPEAPADEITFADNAAIWLMTGFIASTGDIGAAIAFNTIAKRFTLAWYRADIGEIWRVIVNAADYGTVDTSTVSVGEMVELDVLTDPEVEVNELYIIRTG
jgi:hypothetical protein